MEDALTFLKNKKTYISLGLLLAVCAAEKAGVNVVDGIDPDNAVTVAWGAVTGMFMRAGISKSGPA
jgi:hypothetical protein